MVAEAVEHLADRGHRLVAYVSGYDNLQQPIAGAGPSWSAARNSASRCCFRTRRTTRRAPARPRRAACSLGGADRTPSSSTTILTLGGLATIAASGLSIPGDVAVVSLEDSPVCRVVTAQISAFLRDPSRLGAAAAQLLVDDLSALETRTIALPSPQLAVRAPSAQSVHVS